MSGLNEKEYKIIKLIDNQEGPVGSGHISLKMENEFDSSSEATVGRILRELDEKGYTEKVGYQGRVITDNARKELEKYEKYMEKQKFIESIIQVREIENKFELVDVLIARRAIEKETARLASKKINREKILSLEKIIAESQKKVSRNKSGVEEDVQFHKIIAETADNNFLKSALNLIREEAQLSPVLGYIRKEVEGSIVEDHVKIVEALKTGKPHKAENAMKRHLNNIIDDVHTYWESYK